MNPKSILGVVRSLALGAVITAGTLVSSHAQGIPEPGLVMYGTVTNANGAMPILQGSVQWSVSGGGSSTTVPSFLVNVNGQYFYIARVPFETRSVSGEAFTPTPNTLPLTAATTTFNRSAWVLGTNASMVAPTFNFGLADRGRAERVDLRVNLTVDPGLDSDGDGMPDWAEALAGTNPNDANSVLRLSADVQLAQGGGLVIKWSSVAGKTYSVQRSSNLTQSFTSLAANIPATVPLNQFTDHAATNAGPYFYRIQITP